MTRAILLISSILVLSLMLQYVASVITEKSERQWFRISEENSINNGFYCIDCHPDCFACLGVHAGEKRCIQCHRIGYGTSDFDNYYEEHFTSTISCLDCHAYSGKFCECGNGSAPLAGGFGLTNCSEDTGNFAAHISFLKTYGNKSGSRNKACLACHTFMELRVNRSYRALEFNSEVAKSESSGRWKLSDFRLNLRIQQDVPG